MSVFTAVYEHRSGQRRLLRNNSNKLVNQDMDVAPLEDINRSAENTLHEVARNVHDSSLMKRYVEELTRKEREKSASVLGQMST